MPVLTNETGLRYCVEDSIGVVSGNETWYQVEVNDYSNLGATISTVARDPISNDRMTKKGTITDLDSAVEFDADLTVSSFNSFANGFLMANWVEQESFTATGVTVSGFAHAALSASGPLISGGALVENALIYSREFALTANSGLFAVDTGATSTLTPVKVATLETETPPTYNRVDVVGFEADSGDLEVDADGNLTSTPTTGLDFTTLGLTVGQFIFIGDGTTDNSFATAGSSSARISAIAANLLTLDKVANSSWQQDTGTGKTIRLFFGNFLRNVALDHSDYLNQTYQFESRITGLELGDPTQYEYAIGNQANQMTLNLPLTDKATCSFAFIGTDTELPTSTEKSTGYQVDVYDTDAFNTTNDFVKLSLAKSDGSALSAYFKDLTLTINNNVTPEKILGKLGAHRMGIGALNITGTTQVLFDSTEAITAVRNNETVSLDFAIQNDDGAYHFDIPSMTLGGANKTYPRNETVKLDIDGNAFKDAVLGYMMSISYFPYRPNIDEYDA